jgi:hypothetical protein
MEILNFNLFCIIINYKFTACYRHNKEKEMKKLFTILLILLLFNFTKAQEAGSFVSTKMLYCYKIDSTWSEWVVLKSDVEIEIIISSLTLIIQNQSHDIYYLRDMINRFDGKDLTDNDLFTADVFEAKDKIGKSLKIIIYKYESGKLAFQICEKNWINCFSNKN